MSPSRDEPFVELLTQSRLPRRKAMDRIKMNQRLVGEGSVIARPWKEFERIQVPVVTIARTLKQKKQCPSEDGRVPATKMRLACPRMSWSEDVGHK